MSAHYKLEILLSPYVKEGSCNFKANLCLKQSTIIENQNPFLIHNKYTCLFQQTPSYSWDYCSFPGYSSGQFVSSTIILSPIIIMQWQKASSDFDLARGLAQAIGLADRPPLPNRKTQFISNSPTKRERTRRPNTGDFQQVGRQLNTNRVRERQQSLRQQEKVEREHLIRKNAVKDVFINLEKPDQSPIVHAKAKIIISRHDAMRLHKYEQQREVLRKISWDKSRRSRILGDMFQKEANEMLGEESQVWDAKPLGANFFYQPKLFLSSKTKMKRQKDDNLGKLAESFQLSRFSLIKRQGQLHLESRCQRRTQTAQTGRRTVRMRFEKDKCEMLYPSPSESASFFSQ